MPNPKHNKKRRRLDSSARDDGAGPCRQLIVAGQRVKVNEKEGNDLRYPKSMLKEIEAVHRSLQAGNNRAKPSSTKSAAGATGAGADAAVAAAAPHEVFVVIHEELCDCEDTTFHVIGTYARVEAANEKVLAAFRIMHPQFLIEVIRDETSDSEKGSCESDHDDVDVDVDVDDDDDDDSHFVKKRPREGPYPYGFEVAWWIDEHGALSLRAQDRSDDVFKVYAIRQQVQE